ncbi:helix-turn-helix transcriptional regulator [Rhodococcoides fascians]|uniref:helix-turn-helix transcriptional regulator n=1 Tax=Rhodococcoides fascians TaxID=1828 RepID=UPI00056074C8|nr:MULTISPECIES: AAA family ATPase [Rhodococcus]OZF04843.1 helix-turn-helix transcriptional regulator [Rhodococcus sp. 15-1189-1-1a]OZF19106.1 helix-turn-helix transcriptional regulator [Rhodococcus sp. 14-2686-1-2]
MTAEREPAGALVGRDALAASITRMVTNPGAGDRMFWLLGEAGIGKSTLLRHARAVAEDAGVRVLQASGVDAETQQMFSGLQQLLWPVMAYADRLPEAIRIPLDEMLGRAPLPAMVDMYACRHAVLHLLEVLAAESPLVLLLDDAHLLDRDSLDIVVYAVRRVAGPMTTLCSSRGHRIPDGVDPGVAAAEVPSLTDAESAVLLDRQPMTPSRSARLEIIRQAEGNPLAIIEFSRAVVRSGVDLSASTGDDRVRRVQSLFSLRIADLTPQTRKLLLYAASGSGYESLDIITAAAGFGGDLSVWREAEQSGLVVIDGRAVHFTHPLVRSAAYSDCSVDQRRAAHEDFAARLVDDPPCRAWHRAAAADGVDESVAAELEGAAELSHRRGGFFEVARALERAAQISPAPDKAALRYASAAHAAYMAGDPQWGLSLAAQVRRATTSPEIRSAAALPTASILLQTAKPDEAFDVVRRTFSEYTPTDESLTLALLFTALGAAHFSGGEWRRTALSSLAEAIPAPSAGGEVSSEGRDLLSPMPHAAKEAVRQLIAEYSTSTLGAEARVALDETSSIAAKISYLLAEGTRAYLSENSVDALSYFGRGIESLREVGSLGAGAMGMAAFLGALVDTGRWNEVDKAAEEASEVATVGRMALVEAIVEIHRGTIETHRGNVDVAKGHLARAATLFEPRANGALTVDLTRARSFLACVNGDFASAYERLRGVFEDDGTPLHSIQSVLGIADLAWAGARSGQQASARRFVTAIGRAIGSKPPARIRLLRHLAAALVSETTRGAERHYRTAVLDPDGGQWPVERARAQLHYGEWLRRNRRPTDARPQLAAALDTFESVGARTFADIARAELRAAGGTRGSTSTTTDGWASLTAQEQHIATLAAEGLTNRQIGEQLHLSPRTIGSHLYHVYPKLGVSKRHELRGMIDRAAR